MGLTDADVLVGYGGNFGRAQALDQVVEAARRLQDRRDVRFRLRGDGAMAESLRLLASGLSNVEVLPPVAPAQLREEAQAWDLSVVPLADRPIFDGARPSKMFELMGMGIPFAFCGRGEGAAIARRSGGAVVVGPEDPGALAQALRQLADESPDQRRVRSTTMRSFAMRDYDRGSIDEVLEQRLLALVGR
jgi:glycosyltransferase involved in cell wall biosynthesis